jgi:hypothetical protein
VRRHYPPCPNPAEESSKHDLVGTSNGDERSGRRGGAGGVEVGGGGEGWRWAAAATESAAAGTLARGRVGANGEERGEATLPDP